MSDGQNTQSPGSNAPFFSPSLSLRSGESASPSNTTRRALNLPKPLSQTSRAHQTAETPSNTFANANINESEPIEQAPEAGDPWQEPNEEDENAQAVIRQQLQEMRLPQAPGEAERGGNASNSGDNWIHRLRDDDGTPTIQFPDDDDDDQGSDQLPRSLPLSRQVSRLHQPPMATIEEEDEDEVDSQATIDDTTQGPYEDITNGLMANITHFQALEKKYMRMYQPERRITVRNELMATSSKIKSLVEAGRRLLAEMTHGEGIYQTRDYADWQQRALLPDRDVLLGVGSRN
ncbi:hypothetical protein PV10_02865 [Exophiala mesophila]|uniref:Uncharacterized protein n=1 Tax=Exophiala mesophila TaxID=212818 RepID=A0A0D1ZMI3_EXOME|nr:uncharacterized protein PV10_02865 [Exophiala mesophila]KIV95184.1 hypothetical protein PV10_02865 [Exophiala mesophila]